MIYLQRIVSPCNPLDRLTGTHYVTTKNHKHKKASTSPPSSHHFDILAQVSTMCYPFGGKPPNAQEPLLRTNQQPTTNNQQTTTSDQQTTTNDQ